jgi:hypothetical protein
MLSFVYKNLARCQLPAAEGSVSLMCDNAFLTARHIIGVELNRATCFRQSF